MAFSEVERAFAKTPNLGFLLVNKYGIVKFINKKFERFALTAIAARRAPARRGFSAEC